VWRVLEARLTGGEQITIPHAHALFADPVPRLSVQCPLLLHATKEWPHARLRIILKHSTPATASLLTILKTAEEHAVTPCLSGDNPRQDRVCLTVSTLPLSSPPDVVCLQYTR